MTKVIAKSNGYEYLTTITNSERSITADLSLNLGGTNSGFSPTELLAAALSACSVMFITEYCKNNFYTIYQLEITVLIEPNSLESMNNITRNINIGGDLSLSVKNEIIEASKNCNIYKFLTGTTSINTNLVY